MDWDSSFKPNIGDAIDDDDKFEELVSNIDYVEGEIESIRDTLNEMRSQIARLTKKIWKTRSRRQE